MTTGTAIVHRARALVGVRFRPQGRDPRVGVDCVGLVMLVYAVGEVAVRRDYRLRGRHLEELKTELSGRFRRLSPARRRAGDLLLCRVSAEQAHLAISCGDSFVHAHAGLGKVVETPGDPPWQILAAFRPRNTRRKES